jgi:hypothetical protein
MSTRQESRLRLLRVSLTSSYNLLQIQNIYMKKCNRL